MAKIDFRNVEKVANVCGGRAVIAGTRIRVSLILGWHRDGLSVEEIVRHYPHLRVADVHDALAYAFDHPEEMAADFADDDEEVVMKLYPGGPRTP